MNVSRAFKIVLLGVTVAAGGAGLVMLHLENARMQRRVSELRKQEQQAATAREENVGLKQLAQAQRRGAKAAAAAIHTQVVQARREIVELEERAGARHVERSQKAARDAEALATNRDPRHGLTRLEHFQDRGQATPAAALETAIRAVLQADEVALARLCTMPSAARADARALIARLPPEAQARWTPEKLALLWIAGAITEMSAVQITGERFLDGENAVVSIHAPNLTKEEQVKMKLSPAGWTVVIPGSAIERLEKKLRATPGAAR